MSAPESDALLIAGKAYHSRLLVGTGKYKDHDETRRAIVASGAQIVTVAVRRVNIGQNAGEPNLLEVLPPDEFTILPNTAGCYTRSEEHTSELQSLMRISYAVFCLKKKKNETTTKTHYNINMSNIRQLS